MLQKGETTVVTVKSGVAGKQKLYSAQAQLLNISD